MNAAEGQHRSLEQRLMEPVLQLQVLVVLALALGGGGSAYGLRNLVIELAALLVLGLQTRLVRQFFRSAPRALVVLVCASIVLPLVQLVPLPAAVWQALPGREPLAEGLALAGRGEAPWFPLSVNPVRTAVALCATFVPVAMIMVGATLDRERRLRLVRTTVIASFACLLLGILQLSTANSSLLLYFERPENDVLYATFANRNSTGMLFVLALAMLAALPLPRAPQWLFAMVGAGVLLALGVVLTQSRTSMVLALLPLGFALLRAGAAFWTARRGGNPRLQPLLLGGLALALLAAGALGWSAISGGRAAESLSRFSDTQTDRPEMWEDGIYAAGQYFPAGAGTGAFDDVFQMHESLEYVSPRRAGRAHNDYIELAIESGGAGLLLALGWLAWCGVAALRGSDRSGGWQRLGAGVGIAAIALQSLMDYPLRSLSIMAVAAVLVVMLVQARVPEPQP